MFEVKKDPKKIFIAATGQGWQSLNPNTTATLYCLNDYVKTEKYGIKPDRLFIMDVLDEKPQVVQGLDNLGDVISRINALKVPFVAPYKYAEIPLSEAFPLEECAERFGMPYYSNTICYMIAYALLQEPEEIELYGVNQAGSHEYTEERGAVEFWLGMASGMGVKVTVNGKQSQLLRHKGRYGGNILYGYLQTFQQYQEHKKRFGEPEVYRLLDPMRNLKENVRRTIK